MKSTIIALILLVAGSTAALAQCDKKVSITSSKTEHFDSSGTLKNTQDETTVVEFNKTDITVSLNHEGNDQKMTGKVNSSTCNWKVRFKEGKTTMNVTLHRTADESRDFAVVVEGKDGKLTLTAESKEEPDDKIKLVIDKFEEKN